MMHFYLHYYENFQEEKKFYLTVLTDKRNQTTEKVAKYYTKA